jgi:Effector-associated domain 5
MTDYLDLDTIYQLHTAGVEAGLDDPAARPLLLAGINRRYVAGLHRMDTPGDQLLSDLQEMRNVTLANGEVPLATWLVNAVYRLEIRQERTTFQSALEEVWAKREREHPRDQPPPGKQPGTEERIVQSYDLLPQGSDPQSINRRILRRNPGICRAWYVRPMNHAGKPRHRSPNVSATPLCRPRSTNAPRDR